MERSGEEAKAAAPKRPRRCVQSKLSWARVDAAEATDGVQEGSKEGRGKRKKGARSVAGTPQKMTLFTDERQLYESPGCKQESCGVKASGDLNKGEQENVQENAAVKKGSGGKRSLRSKNNCEDSSPNKGSNQKHSCAKRRLVKETFEARKDAGTQSDIARRPVFDLWLEGKKAAEENARLSAGKQTHPFFTSWKATKTKMESRHSLQYDKGKCGSYPPVHVFDTEMDMAVSLDWRNWSFTERTLLDSNGYCASESAPAIFDGSVQPLKLDTVCREKMQADQLPNKAKGSPSASAISASIFSTGQDSNMRSLSELEVAHANSTGSFLSSRSSYAANLDDGHDSGLLKVRLVSYYQRCSYKPESSLWTSKYQPENAFEVCGNSESVRFLGEWLKSWHERGPRSGNTVIHREDYSIGDDEDSSFDYESDMDEIDNQDSLKNALLITGPVGSGKSAAIYACAKEQGFEIIEVNASDFRNGALVRQKYGEGIESHGLNKWWSVKDSISGMRNLEYISSQSDVIEVEESENDTLEMDSQMCDQDRTHTECFVHESSTSQVANKSLILFEDVDIVFDEDRGFTSSILQLAATTKKPIILTSNNKNPTLPQLLDPLILAFDRPSPVELFSHVSMVCGTEKVPISPKLLQQLVNSCGGDIRRTLLALQFWCQGNASKVERNLECTYCPLQFDIDAAHMVIPKVIPWDFPCKLSEKVEEDIGKAISTVEERFLCVDSNEQDFKSMGTPDVSKVGNNIGDTVKMRKNRRLMKKCCSPEEVLAHIDLEDFSDASDSPVTHSHHTVKQRRIAVISSQSDDELPPAGNLATTCMISVEPNSHILSLTSPVQMSHAQDLSELPIGLIEEPMMENTVVNQFEGFEASTSHICDAFKLQDVSCVPESSFVSGSGNNKDGCLSVVASRNTAVSLVDFSMSICDLPGSDYNNLGTDVTEPIKCSGQNLGSACGIDVESVHRNKESACAQNEGEEPQSCGYQVMDEDSLGDSSKCVGPGKELQSVECSLQVDSVPEAWRKLRSRHENLKPYLATNLTNVSLMVKLASGVSDLISDTDVMLSGCKLHLSDVLEPQLTPCSEPDTFSWYDDHCEIGSTFFQHGLCLRTNRCAAVGSTLDYQSPTDLGQEMLAASVNIMALGKLLVNENSCFGGYLQSSRYDDSLVRELKSDLQSTVLPIIPAKSSMTLKGLAFHEYLSFMSQISKLESSRLSKRMNEKQQRRSRTSRHHLSSGQLPLLPGHAEKLAQSFCFNGAKL